MQRIGVPPLLGVLSHPTRSPDKPSGVVSGGWDYRDRVHLELTIETERENDAH
jgi:hypothetical protein